MSVHSSRRSALWAAGSGLGPGVVCRAAENLFHRPPGIVDGFLGRLRPAALADRIGVEDDLRPLHPLLLVHLHGGVHAVVLVVRPPYRHAEVPDLIVADPSPTG